MSKQPTKPSDALRHAIEAGELSRYRICKMTGIDPATLSRFYHGQQGLSLETFDKVAVTLGLELRPVKPARAKRKAGKASKPKPGRKGKAKRKATKRTPKRKGGK